MATIFRLFLVLPFSYIIASAAAGFTIYAAWHTTDLVPQDGQFEFILGAIFVSMAYAAVSLPTSLIGIALAEGFKITSLVPFILLGLANGYLSFWIVEEEYTLGQFGDPFLQSFPNNVESYLAGGSAWGVIFWILAGRLSGAWHSSKRSDEY
ncbi:MAG: hypothetical protein ABJO09_08065 [Hyphomicrobiales bacterium]